ncbi:hypothetical protein FG87_19510 [Nocardia vulneris]|uniref:Acyl-CoA dehydrogenase n=2 Tax=Nocardia vulneris TaxID=1141657 RepID=A0ABR4ZDR4_9NOCA|nr:hypothetical protein FG87_19510 [Nocardia vulneris]
MDYAAMAGLLFRLAGMAAQASIASTADVTTMQARAATVSPKSVALQGEDPAEQARFEAFWLADRVAALHKDQSPCTPEFDAILNATRCSIEAARGLLTIHHGLGCGLKLDGGYAGWDALLYQLGCAYRSATQALTDIDAAAKAVWDPS